MYMYYSWRIIIYSLNRQNSMCQADNMKKYRIDVPFTVDTAFFEGLAGLSRLKSFEEAGLMLRLYEVSKASGFRGELAYDPMKKLYLLAKERIVDGRLNDKGEKELTGRDRNLPGKLEDILAVSSNLPACAKKWGCRTRPLPG